MFHGKFNKHEPQTSRGLLPSRRIEIEIDDRDVLSFANWLDQQLESLEDCYAEFQTVTATRSFYGR